jgi:DHA2 family multidrug resistance protein
MSRNLGGSIGIAILTSYLTRHQQIHQAYLTGQLSTSNVGYRNELAQITQTIMSFGHSMATSAHMALGSLYRQLLHQSDLLAFNDSFRFMAIVMGILAFIALLMPYNNPQAKQSPAAAGAH